LIPVFVLKKSPESLQTIDMISFSIAVLFFAVINETVDESSGSDAGIYFPGI
jgi:hypothetical protein